MKVGAEGLLRTVTVPFMGSVPNGMVDQKVEHSGGEMPVEVACAPSGAQTGQARL